MTNNTNATKREALSAAALLWVADDGAVPRAAPEEFGGAAWDQQLKDVTEWVTREGATLDDHSSFIAHISGNHLGGMRLVRLLEFVTQHPTRRVLVPSSVFADLTFGERDVYIAALDALGTELIFCDA